MQLKADETGQMLVKWLIQRTWGMLNANQLFDPPVSLAQAALQIKQR